MKFDVGFLPFIGGNIDSDIVNAGNTLDEFSRRITQQTDLILGAVGRIDQALQSRLASSVDAGLVSSFDTAGRYERRIEQAIDGRLADANAHANYIRTAGGIELDRSLPGVYTAGNGYVPGTVAPIDRTQSPEIVSAVASRFGYDFPPPSPIPTDPDPPNSGNWCVYVACDGKCHALPEGDSAAQGIIDAGGYQTGCGLTQADANQQAIDCFFLSPVRGCRTDWCVVKTCFGECYPMSYADAMDYVGKHPEAGIQCGFIDDADARNWADRFCDRITAGPCPPPSPPLPSPPPSPPSPPSPPFPSPPQPLPPTGPPQPPTGPIPPPPGPQPPAPPLPPGCCPPNPVNVSVTVTIQPNTTNCPPTIPPTTPPNPSPIPPDQCPELPAKEWCVYVTADGCNAYAVKCSAGPSNAQDTLYLSGVTADEANGVARTIEALACPPTDPNSNPPQLPTWSGSTICQIDQYSDILTTGVNWAGGRPAKPSVAQTFADNATLNKGGFDIASAIGNGLNRIFNGIKYYAARKVDSITEQVVTNAPCQKALYARSFGWRIFWGIAAKYISGPIAEINQPDIYIQHGACPQLMPSVDEATDAYLANALNAQQFQTLVQINDHCPGPWAAVLEARRSKLKPEELNNLRAKGVISGNDYNLEMRRLGYLYPDQWSALWEQSHKAFPVSQAVELYNRDRLSISEVKDQLRINGLRTNQELDNAIELGQQVPPYTDLVRFMTRDAADQQAVKDGKLDDDFPTKYGPKIKEWAKHQGISDEVMKYVWRAHWHLPSPGQLYEMVHRFGNLPAGDPLRTTVDDVKKTLKQDDYAPAWVERLVALSYSPLTRVDARRAYNLGVIDRDELLQTLQDQGYHSDNAERLAKFFDRIKIESARNDPVVKAYDIGKASTAEVENRLTSIGFTADMLTEFWKLHRADRFAKSAAILQLRSFKRFQVGAISFADFQADIVNRGWHPDLATWAKDEAVNAVRSNANASCIKSIGLRFVTGEITDGQLVGELDQLGLDPDIEGQIVRGLRCRRASRSRKLTASMLCRLVDDGLLSPLEMAERLERIGYTRDDAIKLTTDCTQRLQIKRTKELDRERKAQQRELEKQRAKDEREAKDDASRIERAERASKAARKAEEARQIAIAKAGEKLARARNLDVSDSIIAVTRIRQFARENGILDPNEATKLAVLTAEVAMVRKDETLEDLATELIIEAS